MPSHEVNSLDNNSRTVSTVTDAEKRGVTTINSRADSSSTAAQDSEGNKNGKTKDKDKKFKRLTWPQLTICLIVEAVALGSLSLPAAFAALGMVPAVIVCVLVGLLAIYTSYVLGQVKLKYSDQIDNYDDAVGLIFGVWGKRVTGVMIILFMILLTGGHTLTGTIAFYRISNSFGICALGFSAVSAVILFLLALPPTFHEFAWLGYLDFTSIIGAIMVTIIGVGIAGAAQYGGLGAVDWSLWPPADMTFTSAFQACTSIIFAYSFAVCQFTFMAQMKKPDDYEKSIWALGLVEIFIYTLTGAFIYAFVGSAVKSPALLSAGPTLTRVAFFVALPVIFISGSINTTVLGRFLLDEYARDHPRIRDIQGMAGWISWILLIALLTFVAWLVAEAIPYFGPLLGLISALFISGFSFYFPAMFWFRLVMQGRWYDRRNIIPALVNGLIFIVGMIILVAGTYTSIQDIINETNSGDGRGPFSCSSAGYL